EKFAALVLQEAPKALESPRGQLREGPDSRVVRLARLAGVEPAARGFEGRCSIQLSYRRVRLLVPLAPGPRQAAPFSLTPSGARSRTLRFRGARRLAERTDLREIGRGGREAEGAGLLNQYTAQSCIEGSNPSLSARVDEGPLAQLDRASDYESEGRRFESCRARHPRRAARLRRGRTVVAGRGKFSIWRSGGRGGRRPAG